MGQEKGPRLRMVLIDSKKAIPKSSARMLMSVRKASMHYTVQWRNLDTALSSSDII